MMQAASIPGCSKATVVQNFPHHHINIISDPQNPDGELMEIRFKDIIVTYEVNDQGICHTGYLFSDGISDFENYLNVCEKYFNPVTLNSWKYENCCIELMKEGPDFYFLFHI